MGNESQIRTSVSVTRVIAAGLLTWLVSSCVLAYVVGRVNLPGYWVLAHRGVRTEGVVVGKEPNNHQLVRYSFTVDQSPYSNSDQVTAANPDFASLKIGDRVTVL